MTHLTAATFHQSRWSQHQSTQNEGPTRKRVKLRKKLSRDLKYYSEKGLWNGVELWLLLFLTASIEVTFNFLVLVERPFRSVSLATPAQKPPFYFICSPSVSFASAFTEFSIPRRTFTQAVSVVNLMILIIRSRNIFAFFHVTSKPLTFLGSVDLSSSIVANIATCLNLS